MEIVIITPLSEGGPTTLSRLAELGREMPENSELLTDLVAQHDHYLYGTPKRP